MSVSSLRARTQRGLPSAARAGALVVLVGIAYYASERLGYLFAISNRVVTLWPPSGLMLGILLVSRRRDWPAIVIGGLLGSVGADLHSGYSIPLAIGATLANGAETIFAAQVVSWRLRRRITLSSLRDVGELVLSGAVVSNAVTACLGAVLLHVGFRTPLPRAWLLWWIGDGLGMMIVAPIIICGMAIRAHRPWHGRRVAEGVILLIVIALVSQTILGPAHQWAVQPGSYAILPLIFWAALRFGPFGGAAATLTVAVIATWNAALGFGPFAGASLSSAETAAQIYAFLAVASLCGLVSAAVLDERELAARRQRESEDRYRAVVEAVTDVILTTDDDGRIQFVNPAVEGTFGYSPDELIGQELTLLLPEAFGRFTFPWHAAAMAGLRKDGTEIQLEVSFGERSDDARRVSTAILRDISEKRAAEQALAATEDRMRFALEASCVGVWEVDFATGVTRWSTTLEALHGLAPGAFGGTFGAFIEQIYAEDRPQIEAEIERATRNHTDASIAYRSIWPDGSIHWLSGVGRTFYDASGNPTRAVGIGFDVTERRALEEQYRQAQKMEAIGQLAGGVAHDFNNLLTAIQGYGSMLAEEFDSDSPHREDVGEILHAATRAASLTRQLLAFSRQQVLAPRALNLGDSVCAIEPMLRRLIGEHIDLQTRIDPDVGQVLADFGQIEQVILNLAVNARDAMPNGGFLLLEVSNAELDEDYARTHLSIEPGRYVTLAVSDNGVGMDAATAARIFDPFFTTKPVGKGTGIGLSTVYGIVKQSNGAIRVYSEPGRGTTFRAYLPRVDQQAEIAGVATAETHRPGTETVLLVEDDAAIRKMAKRALERAGYTTLSAGTPAEAFEAAKAYDGEIDLLLTDVVLPEMSGRVVAQKLSQQQPGLRVLYMSGYTGDAVLLRGVLEREAQFLQKPFTHNDLLRKVRETLDNPV